MKKSGAQTRRLIAAMLGWLLLAALNTILTASPSHAAETPVPVPSNAETVPVSHSGDAMDDPAVWVHPTNPSRSLLMGNDKGGAFDTYDLDGTLVQRLDISSQFWGNVDVRQGVTIGGQTRDIVGVVQRGVRFYDVDPDTRLLSQTTEGSAPIGVNGEGFCLYESPTTDKVYGISITIGGTVNQFELLDADQDGLLESSTVRTFSVGSEAEGCVADDDTGALYISEENEALWRYSAEPGAGTTREAVDVLAGAGGHLINDIEGVTIVDQGEGVGFVIVSVQNAPDPNASYFSVYRREAGNAFVNTFRVADGTGSDDCDRTDGITAVTADLGSAFPRGMFVCQDNNNNLPGTSGNQNLKMVRLENVVNLDGGPPPPPPPPPPTGTIEFVGRSTSNTNARTFNVQVPAATQAGDALLLFAAQGSTTSLGNPGAGWTQAGRVADGAHATTVWRKVATANDAGDTVSLSSGTTYTKVGLTLAAYRGTDPTAPVATIAGAPEPGSTASHTSPLVNNSVTGARRVSFWSDKNSSTTSWTAPAGETARGTSIGSGGGRVGTLLTDSTGALTAGTPAMTGGLVARANAEASTATAWTILLKPVAPPPPPDNEPPVARFTWDCEELVCSFDATTSSDAEDSIASYAWTFGDDGAGIDATPEHTYDEAGSYVVELTVTDDDQVTDTVTHTVAVGDLPQTPITFVGQATRNVNSTAFTVQVPASVSSGDALLLFASQGSTSTLTGPGAGWTQAGRVVDGSHATTVWRRLATAADAGSTVRLTSGTTYTKVAMTLAAYRGTDQTNPVASITGAGEPGSTTAHTTPTVANSTAGAWRVSYWSDKNSATTAWTNPSGETRRAVTVGSGGGRIGSLLTDPGSVLTAGTPPSTGGLTATANAAASTATAWTILLRPAG